MLVPRNLVEDEALTGLVSYYQTKHLESTWGSILLRTGLFVTPSIALSGLGSTSWFMYYEIFLLFCSDKSTVELTFPSDTEFKGKNHTSLVETMFNIHSSKLL